MSQAPQVPTPSRMASRQSKALNHLLSTLPVVAVLLTMAGVYLYNSWRSSFPAGYAGLYAMMAEVLTRQPWPLPDQIPFYGPGGMPFAYPPIGPYLAALFVGPLDIPTLDYMRWAPAMISILAMIGTYLFARELTGDRAKALASVVIVFSAELFYSYHATASGSVRGLALLWTMLGAWLALKAFGGSPRWLVHGFLAGTCLALAAMTHLAYAAFLVLGIVLMALLGPRSRPLVLRLGALALIAAAGLLLSAPWWATILARYGHQVFWSAFTTHGTGGLIGEVGFNPLALSRAVLRWYVNLGRTWWPPFLSGLAILSLTYGLVRRRWLLPAWTLATVMTLGETDRFVILLCGLLAGEMLVDVARTAATAARWPSPAGMESAGSLVFLVLALAPILVLGFRGIQWTEVRLTDEAVEVAGWIADHSAAGDRYLYLGDTIDVAEWLPYLTHRTPGVSPWGAEWTGRYIEQLKRMEQLSGCPGTQAAGCLPQFIESIGGNISWLILPVEKGAAWASLAEDPGWAKVFSNDSFSVYRKKD